MTRIASLCSGYEGIGLGLAEALGIDLAEALAWHAENDDAPARVHEHHFPDIPNYWDIKTICWPLCEPVDWLTAGYPCQPFSLAGQRKGTDDPRHLWPYIADAIRVLRPGNVLLENVPGHLSSGFGTALGDLAEIGYDVRWTCLPASGVGAPHKRERVFILATNAFGEQRPWGAADRRDCDMEGPLSVPSGWHEDSNEPERPAATTRTFGGYADAITRWERVTGRPAPGPLELGPKGNWRYAARFGEWMMGLPDGWITSPEIGLSYSVQKKIIGNGVVPQQCAEAVRHLMSPT